MTPIQFVYTFNITIITINRTIILNVKNNEDMEFNKEPYALTFKPKPRCGYQITQPIIHYVWYEVYKDESLTTLSPKGLHQSLSRIQAGPSNQHEGSALVHPMAWIWQYDYDSCPIIERSTPSKPIKINATLE